MFPNSKHDLIYFLYSRIAVFIDGPYFVLKICLSFFSLCVVAPATLSMCCCVVLLSNGSFVAQSLGCFVA